MKAPLSWLRELTPVTAPAAEVASVLSSLGLVVDVVIAVPEPWPGIVVARVLGTRPHPAADRIQLVDVDAGLGEALQICCGAFNMKEGDLVPLATLGTVMPGGMEIARRKMRGEWSNGMLCSAAELGLGPEGSVPGIYLLDQADAQPGQALAQALGLAEDAVFDIDVTPNRSDCFSIVGIARDLAAGLGLPLNLPAVPNVVHPEVEAAAVSVDATAVLMCPRFTGTVLEDVASARVPVWVPYRLALCGMRSINPVVDVSNYVMLELGQPNHPYDLDRLGAGALVVRAARDGERLETLDGATRVLQSGDCVIADGHGEAVGLAGVMGGRSAEISASTRRALLEMANFEPRFVAVTGKRLGLSSEARTRFERGVDIELAPVAIDRFVQLLGGQVRRGPTTDARAVPLDRRRVTLRPARVNQLLGTSLGAGQCGQLLGRLGFGVDYEGPNLVASVPTWRLDCHREVDLVEEVARIYGYDKLPKTPPSRVMTYNGLSSYQKGRRAAREALAGAGVSEAWTATFVGEAEISATGLSPERALLLENPLDRSQDRLRPSLLPGLFGALRANRERQAASGLSLFEIGNVFCAEAGPGQHTTVPGVVESEQLAVVAMGHDIDAAYAVAVWQVLAGQLRLSQAELGPWGHDDPMGGLGGPAGCSALEAGFVLHPGRRSIARCAGAPVGVVGELAPDLARAVGVPGRVAVLALDLATLLGAPRAPWQVDVPSRYPASDLDLAFVVDEDVLVSELARTVREAAAPLAEAVVLFDVWKGQPLGPGQRSLGFRARLRAPDRTLTEEEVSRARQKVAEAVHAAHGGLLRSDADRQRASE